jgi:hypothetical protein
MTDADAEADRLAVENRILRGLVQTNPSFRCPHGMGVTDISLCPLGFPGCACADDRLAITIEDGARLIAERDRVAAKLAALRHKLEIDSEPFLSEEMPNEHNIERGRYARELLAMLDRGATKGA